MQSLKRKQHKMSRYLFILLILFKVLLLKGQQKAETVFLEVDGMDRYYRLYVPESYSNTQHSPVLFVFHGGGGRADRMERYTNYRFNALADQHNFLVVYPNGYKKGWNDGARDTVAVARRQNINDVGFFDAILNDVNTKLNIDKQNIFACGISNGGFMVQRLAFERSHKLNAIAVVAANLSVDQSTKAPPEKPVSVLFMCGTDDPLVPYNGGYVSVFGQKRGEVISMPESIRFWKELNNCTKLTERRSFPDLNSKDNCTAHKTVWQNPKKPNVKVVDITIKNGGHTWPGKRQYLPKSMVGATNKDINGSDEVWSFFQSVLK